MLAPSAVATIFSTSSSEGSWDISSAMRRFCTVESKLDLIRAKGHIPAFLSPPLLGKPQRQLLDAPFGVRVHGVLHRVHAYMQ